MADIVKLNVGGCIYSTSRSTLTRYPDSMLGSMFSGKMETSQDKDGNYWIDGNGEIFRYVLDFLRRSRLLLPNDFKDFELLESEADFYQIPELIEAVKSKRGKGGKLTRNKGRIIVVEYTVVTDETGGPITINGPADAIEQLRPRFERYKSPGGQRSTEKFRKVNMQYSIANIYITQYDNDIIPLSGIMQEIMNIGFKIHTSMPEYNMIGVGKAHLWFIEDDEN